MIIIFFSRCNDEKHSLKIYGRTLSQLDSTCIVNFLIQNEIFLEVLLYSVHPDISDEHGSSNEMLNDFRCLHKNLKEKYTPSISHEQLCSRGGCRKFSNLQIFRAVS